MRKRSILSRLDVAFVDDVVDDRAVAAEAVVAFHGQENAFGVLVGHCYRRIVFGFGFAPSSSSTSTFTSFSSFFFLFRFLSSFGRVGGVSGLFVGGLGFSVGGDVPCWFGGEGVKDGAEFSEGPFLG